MGSDFSRVLSLLRQEKNISQRKASSELGVSQALLSHYENGVREPGLAFVVKAADFYNVSCDYLLGRTMSKEGNSIHAEDVHDVSTEKGNVLKGSAMAMLSKKLLVNSTALLMDMLARCGNKAIIADVTSYLSIYIYKAFRYVYMMDKGAKENVFPTPTWAFDHLCDAEARKCEYHLKQAATLEQEELPIINWDSMQRDFPMLAPSAYSVLQSVSEKLQKNN